jgi:hypothetical protein
MREIWKFIHPRESYSLRETPEGNMILVSELISYFLKPHAINVLLYRMKPRKHIHVKYCWQTYLERCLRHLKTTSTSDAFRVSLTFSCQGTIALARKHARLPRGWNMIFNSRNMIFVLCDHVFLFLPIVQSN